MYKPCSHSSKFHIIETKDIQNILYIYAHQIDQTGIGISITDFTVYTKMLSGFTYQ